MAMGKFESVDAFLAAQPDVVRAALEELRQVILAAVPDATEGINYGVPMFKLRGKNLVSFGSAKVHCSFYVQSTDVVAEHAADLAAYDAEGGTVRFKADAPLPASLVTKLVKARVAENERGATR